MQIACGLILVSLLHKTLQQYQGCQVSNCLRCDDGYCSLCNPGYYGEDCGQQCPVNCDQLCISGYCHKGCNKGWYGSKCQDPCPIGCGDCNQDTGNCSTSMSTPQECPEGCYCVYGYCSHCKPGYVVSGDHCQTEDIPGETTNSNYTTLKSALIGIGLVLGVTALISCVIFVFCRKYKKARPSTVSNCERELPSPNDENVPSVELHEMGGNSIHGGILPLPPYYVSYPPPSYDSLFLTEAPDTTKPTPYESTDHF